MEVPPQSSPDWEALADAEVRLVGSLDAAGFDRRLAEALATERAEGRVDYALDFRRLSSGAAGLSGSLHAELAARCQRCLEPFELVLDLAPRLAFSPVANGVGWEPIEDGFPESLAALIEGELLLGLPFAPRHPPAECPAAVQSPTPEAGVKRPFAGLAEVLKQHRGRSG